MKQPTSKKKPAPKKVGAPQSKKSQPVTSVKKSSKPSSVKKNLVKKPVSAKPKTSGNTKEAYLKRHNMKVRPVTQSDKKYATNDFQKKAKYIIYCGEKQYFSANGSLSDCRAVVAMQKGGNNVKK